MHISLPMSVLSGMPNENFTHILWDTCSIKRVTHSMPERVDDLRWISDADTYSDALRTIFQQHLHIHFNSSLARRTTVSASPSLFPLRDSGSHCSRPCGLALFLRSKGREHSASSLRRAPSRYLNQTTAATINDTANMVTAVRSLTLI